MVTATVTVTELALRLAPFGWFLGLRVLWNLVAAEGIPARVCFRVANRREVVRYRQGKNLYVCMYVCDQVGVYVHVCVCVCLFFNAYIHTCMVCYIHIYTHIWYAKYYIHTCMVCYIHVHVTYVVRMCALWYLIYVRMLGRYVRMLGRYYVRMLGRYYVC